MLPYRAHGDTPAGLPTSVLFAVRDIVAGFVAHGLGDIMGGCVGSSQILCVGAGGIPTGDAVIQAR